MRPILFTTFVLSELTRRRHVLCSWKIFVYKKMSRLATGHYNEIDDLNFVQNEKSVSHYLILDGPLKVPS